MIRITFGERLTTVSLVAICCYQLRYYIGDDTPAEFVNHVHYYHGCA